MKNRITSLTFVLALGSLSLSGIAMAQQAMTQPQVNSKLTEQGYTRIHDLKFKDGMWRAEAKSANGEKVHLRVDAKTGQVYPDEQVSKLSEQDIRASLESQGYTHVHDVDFDDGMWKAKADNPSGNKVKLKVDAGTGKVVAID
ncbi:PepSY domain-containing protein [Rhodanobacter sp. Col0626]|uniref:PepSY domain-containing protein n=1 Tax=Rhodanobacter sp. Col0626 TaxID=3415679 RepID=UPI003CF0C014